MQQRFNEKSASRFVVLQEFMTETLNLKGNELLVYAIIYGFSQDGESAYTGSLRYLCSWTKATKQGVIKNLKSLIEKGLIVKKESYKNSVKYCEYRTTLFNTPVQQSLPNNINDTIKEKDNTNVLSKERALIDKYFNETRRLYPRKEDPVQAKKTYEHKFVGLSEKEIIERAEKIKAVLEHEEDRSPNS